MENAKLKFRELLICTLSFFIFAVVVSSCGYRFIGSQSLPFDAITIKPVRNNTYEPKLEEKMHDALSIEFIHQGSTGWYIQLNNFIGWCCIYQFILYTCCKTNYRLLSCRIHI